MLFDLKTQFWVIHNKNDGVGRWDCAIHNHVCVALGSGCGESVWQEDAEEWQNANKWCAMATTEEGDLTWVISVQ